MKTQEVETVVRNVGLVTLKNVVVTMHANESKFGPLVSSPFLSDQFDSDVDSSSNAYAKISLLPPASEIIVTSIVNISNAEKKEPLYVNVMSEQAIGRFNTAASWAFYLGLAALYAYLFLVFYRGYGLTSLDKGGVIFAILFISIYVVGFYVGFLILNERLNFLESYIVIGFGAAGAVFFASWVLIDQHEMRHRKRSI